MPERLRATGESTEFPYKKKASAKGTTDELRPEYDLSKLKGGVRRKHYREATAGTNLVLIEHELADVFEVHPPAETKRSSTGFSRASSLSHARASRFLAASSICRTRPSRPAIAQVRS